MTPIHRIFLCAVVIAMMLAAGCTSPNTSGASPLITETQASSSTPVPSTPAVAATTQPGTAGTQSPGTCTADINNDAANCGGCGYACPANALCQQGQCFCKEGYTVENNACAVASAVTGSGNGCPAGMNPCSDGYCYELTSSASNCGICGNQCPAGMICSASTCSNVPTETTTAPVTTTAAVTTTTTSATTTTTTSPGTTWTLGGIGTSKACFVKGMTNCDGTCVNLSINNGNCGSCGHICSGLTATCCGGGCTSLKTDESNCGTCGHKCSIGSTCESGSCKVKVGVYVTGQVLVTPKISLKVTVPQYQQPVVVLPGNI
jgi:hypothetical protein